MELLKCWFKTSEGLLKVLRGGLGIQKEPTTYTLLVTSKLDM